MHYVRESLERPHKPVMAYTLGAPLCALILRFSGAKGWILLIYGGIDFALAVGLVFYVRYCLSLWYWFTRRNLTWNLAFGLSVSCGILALPSSLCCGGIMAGVLAAPLAFGLLSLAGLYADRLWPRARRFMDSRNCLECGYNLTGNVSGVCPECGAESGVWPPETPGSTNALEELKQVLDDDSAVGGGSKK